MDPLYLLSKVASVVLPEYFRERFRRQDLRFVVPTGVLYWLLYSTGVYLLRAHAFPAAGLILGNPSPLDPARLLIGSMLGVLMAVFVAFMQVAPGGVPRGLTLDMAIFPVVLLISMLSGSAVEIGRATGSPMYAVTWLTLSALNMLWLSLVLRRLRT